MRLWQIFKSISIDSSAEPLPYEPDVAPLRTIGTTTLKLETHEGRMKIDVVEIDGQTFRKEQIR